MSARIAGFRLQFRMVPILGPRMMVVRYGRLMVFVRSRSVVMIRVIMSDVLVYVQRRPHGRRADQGLDQQTCDETPHGGQSTTTLFGGHVARIRLLFVRVLSLFVARSGSAVTAAPKDVRVG